MSSILQDVESYISFENGKWVYIEQGGIIHLNRNGEFHNLASKSEICMFHKLLSLENSKHIEYDMDSKRIK